MCFARCYDSRQFFRLRLCELDLCSELQFSGELDELADAELRYATVQEIADVRLVNAQECTELLLCKPTLLNVLEQIAVNLCLHLDLECFGRAKAEIIEHASPRQVGVSFLAFAFDFHYFAPP